MARGIRTTMAIMTIVAKSSSGAKNIPSTFYIGKIAEIIKKNYKRGTCFYICFENFAV